MHSLTPGTLSLTKHHGLGNDFLVVINPPVEITGEMARAWCDRRRGVGADGLLVATHWCTGWFSYAPALPEHSLHAVSPAPDHDAAMVLFNADGSRAEMSGNGIRCLAHALHRTPQFPRESEAVEPDEFEAWSRRPVTYRIATDAGVRLVEVVPTDDPDVIVASVSMGAASTVEAPTNWAALGLDALRPVVHLSMGNPHSVVAVDDVWEVDLAAAGGLVPHVNLEIVMAGPEPHAITMRVHERGAGITEACGTGASAAAHAAVRWGLVDQGVVEVLVHMDGGDAIVRITDDDLVLVGPSVFVAEIQIPCPELAVVK